MALERNVKVIERIAPPDAHTLQFNVTMPPQMFDVTSDNTRA